MLKVILSIIISLSLALTSGLSQPVIAQQRLASSFQELGASNIQAEITAWVPADSLRASLPNGLTAQGLSSVLREGWQISEREVAADSSNLVIASLRTHNLTNVVETYLNLRSTALRLGGGANLTVKAQLPRSAKGQAELGRQFIAQLGGRYMAQELEDSNLFSAASEVPGWGQTINVGQDKINLQVVLRPDSSGKYTHLYLMAPVLLTDL